MRIVYSKKLFRDFFALSKAYFFVICEGENAEWALFEKVPIPCFIYILLSA